ncbi:glutamate--tRNA ligase [bacterium]|nr:glutamate--tRNA ligase [bacterium]
MPETRLRFAPSPTGFLHVGGLRTALFNYLYARHTGGRFILRIEDTDQSRKVEGAVENLMESLRWAGLDFDEGPGIEGEYAPYIQSQRLDHYRKYAQQLLDQKDAYPCFCTETDLQQMREEQLARKEDTRYDGRCRHLAADDVKAKLAAGTSHVIRMKIDHARPAYIVNDLIRGEVHFTPDQIDDQVLIKSDGFPTYHLANVVDDHLMKISHVIRGEEWLPSTPKHIQLYEYFGWEIPAFAHLPLLLNTDRSKLSKRQGDVATEDYRNKGYLPECLINFVALLGWNTQDDQEIYTMAELIANFSLERVGKSGAVFDTSKLNWMNQQYIKQKSAEELFDLLQPFLPEYTNLTTPEKLQKIIQIVRDSLVTLPDIANRLDLFYHNNPVLQSETLINQVKSDPYQQVYKSFVAQLEQIETLNAENFGQVMKSVQKETGIKGKNLWIPMRIAITLAEEGPDLASVVDVFGKDRCLHMVKNVIV